MSDPIAPPTQSREQWLEAAAQRLAPLAGIGKHETPRISVGFPSTRALSTNKRRIGECWHAKACEDGRPQVYISPVLTDPIDVLATVLHELGHVRFPDAGHKGPFKRFMKQAGLEGKPTATVPGPQCTLTLRSIAADLGPYPHSKLTPSQQRKKQTTRLLKAQCPACECTIRVTAKWAGDEGKDLPFCGWCAIPGNVDTFERMVLATGGEGE